MTLPRRRSDGRGSLEAGQQDQPPGADQVLHHPVQSPEDQPQQATQPADDAGTLFNQVRPAGGAELQLRGDLIAGGSGGKSRHIRPWSATMIAASQASVFPSPGTRQPWFTVLPGICKQRLSRCDQQRGAAVGQVHRPSAARQV
jgi:hypothetical protein